MKAVKSQFRSPGTRGMTGWVREVTSKDYFVAPHVFRASLGDHASLILISFSLLFHMLLDRETLIEIIGPHFSPPSPDQISFFLVETPLSPPTSRLFYQEYLLRVIWPRKTPRDRAALVMGLRPYFDAGWCNYPKYMAQDLLVVVVSMLFLYRF